MVLVGFALVAAAVSVLHSGPKPPSMGPGAGPGTTSSAAPTGKPPGCAMGRSFSFPEPVRPIRGADPIAPVGLLPRGVVDPLATPFLN